VKRAAALLVLLAAPSLAGAAEPFDRLAEGETLYAAARPLALAAVLRRLGVGELPEVQRVKQQLGGLDPLDPGLLAPTGLDIGAPIVAGFGMLDAQTLHVRAVAALRDATLFTSFLAAIAASGQVPLQRVDPATPAGKAGVLATFPLPDGMAGIVRRPSDGDALVVDVLGRADQKPIAPVEAARRVPLTVVAPFHPTRGARRLFSSDSALTLYVDARQLTPVVAAFARLDVDKAVAAAAPKQRATLRARRLGALGRCRAEVTAAPTTFDDAGLALLVDAGELRLVWAWGTQGATPLGGLRFSPVDDGALDAGLLARDAQALLAIYAASLEPFRTLKRSGPFVSADSLDDFTRRCGESWGAALILRSWPQLIGAYLGVAQTNAQQLGPLAQATQMFGQLRNVLFVLREMGPPSLQFAVSATFDAAAKPLLETILSVVAAAGLGGGGAPAAAPRTLGRCSPSLYNVAVSDAGEFVAGLETLKSGPVQLSVADSEQSIGWACRKLTPMPGGAPAPAAPAGPTPLAALHVDGGLIGRLASQLGNANAQLNALIARTKRVDADVIADGDTLRLTVHAPIK
jgi:hypothetical protein